MKLITTWSKLIKDEKLDVWCPVPFWRLVAGFLLLCTAAIGQIPGTVVTPSEAIRVTFDGGLPTARTVVTKYSLWFDEYFLDDVWSTAGARCYDASSYTDAGAAAAWFSIAVEPACYPVSSVTNIWDSGVLAERASDFRNAERLLALFEALYGRAGADGAGEKLLILSGMQLEGAQAFPIFRAIALGRGDPASGIPSYGVIDVIAHKFGHLVNWHDWEHSADSYEGQLRGVRGTVDEHLADMFGVIAKYYLSDDSWVNSVRWVHGAESHYGVNYPHRNDADFVRSVAGDRNYYLATDGFVTRAHASQLYTGALDNGGVHANALILGRAFYLFTEGGLAGNSPDGLALPGWPSNIPNQLIQGIGMDRFAKLAYRVTQSTGLSTIVQAEQDAGLMIPELRAYASIVHSACLTLASEEGWPNWVSASVKNAFAAVGLMDPTADEQPKLACAVTSTAAQLSFSNLEANREYRVMRSSTLSDWVEAYRFTATASTGSWSEPLAPEGLRFYRLEWNQ